MKNTLLFISIVLVLFGCKKDNTVEEEVEKDYGWTQHEGFQYNDVVQMNGYAAGNFLFFMGISNFTSMVADSLNHPDASFGGNLIRYVYYYELPSEKKFPVCADYFILCDQVCGTVYFIPTMNPVSSGTDAYVSLKEIDSSFHRFKFIHFTSGESIEINERNQTLVPYSCSTDSFSVLKLALINVNVDSSFVYNLDAEVLNLITITDALQNSVVAMNSIGDNFYVTTNSYVYRIDHLGNIVKVLDERFYKIIESMGKLYGFGIDHIYISNDNGLTWSIGYETDFNYILLNYTKIDDRIIGYRYGQLWEITINDSGVSGKELNNDGLDGISITSVNKFYNKVYLSTLSGVFCKPYDKFFKYK